MSVPLDILALAVASSFFQVSALILVVPVFGEQTVSVRLRVFVTLVMTFVLFPERSQLLLGPDCTALDPAIIVLQSALSGLLLGLTFRFALFALQVLGSIISQLSSLSQIVGVDIARDPSPPVAQLLIFSALFVFCALDFHLLLLDLLSRPSGICVSAGMVQERLFVFTFDTAKTALYLAVLLSAPYIAMNLLYSAMIGFLNRAMPQLMVAFVGAPLLVGGFMLFLALVLPDTLRVWCERMSQTLPGGLCHG